MAGTRRSGEGGGEFDDPTSDNSLGGILSRASEVEAVEEMSDAESAEDVERELEEIYVNFIEEAINLVRAIGADREETSVFALFREAQIESENLEIELAEKEAGLAIVERAFRVDPSVYQQLLPQVQTLRDAASVARTAFEARVSDAEQAEGRLAAFLDSESEAMQGLRAQSAKLATRFIKTRLAECIAQEPVGGGDNIDEQTLSGTILERSGVATRLAADLEREPLDLMQYGLRDVIKRHKKDCDNGDGKNAVLDPLVQTCVSACRGVVWEICKEPMYQAHLQNLVGFVIEQLDALTRCKSEEVDVTFSLTMEVEEFFRTYIESLKRRADGSKVAGASVGKRASLAPASRAADSCGDSGETSEQLVSSVDDETTQAFLTKVIGVLRARMSVIAKKKAVDASLANLGNKEAANETGDDGDGEVGDRVINSMFHGFVWDDERALAELLLNAEVNVSRLEEAASELKKAEAALLAVADDVTDKSGFVRKCVERKRDYMFTVCSLVIEAMTLKWKGGDGQLESAVNGIMNEDDRVAFLDKLSDDLRWQIDQLVDQFSPNEVVALRMKVARLAAIVGRMSGRVSYDWRSGAEGGDAGDSDECSESARVEVHDWRLPSAGRDDVPVAAAVIAMDKSLDQLAARRPTPFVASRREEKTIRPQRQLAPQKSWVRRHPWAAGGVAVLGLYVVTGAAWYLGAFDGSEESSEEAAPPDDGASAGSGGTPEKPTETVTVSSARRYEASRLNDEIGSLDPREMLVVVRCANGNLSPIETDPKTTWASFASGTSPSAVNLNGYDWTPGKRVGTSFESEANSVTFEPPLGDICNDTKGSDGLRIATLDFPKKFATE